MRKIITLILMISSFSIAYYIYDQNKSCCSVDLSNIEAPLIVNNKSIAFQESITKPEWFNSVNTIRIHNEKEMSELWRSEKRCCESKSKLFRNNKKFFKSCYNAITEHYEDEKLVVKCLWLMGFGEAREQDIQAKSFIVNNFPQHISSVDNCANCDTGDVYARSAHSLANYKQSKELNKSISLIENALTTRGNDISHWIQIDMYVDLCRFYLKQEKITQNQKDFIIKGYGFLFAENKNVERRLSALKTLKRYKSMILEK
jgi:hypothetical protein